MPRRRGSTWEFRHRFAAIAPRAARLGRITEVGHAPATTLAARRTRVLKSYACVYVADGEARFFDADGGMRRLAPGDVLMLFPGREHRYAPEDGATWTQFWICFEGPVFDAWREAGLLDPANPIRRALPVERWLRRFREVAQAGVRAPSGGQAFAEVLRLQALLADLYGPEATSVADAGNDSRWAERACALLENADAASRPAVPAAAGALGLGAEAFRKRFTRLLGIAPGRYLLRHRIDRACALMRESGAGNDELAARLGFCDGFHFSRRFRQVAGLSPQAFRAQLCHRTYNTKR